MGVLPLFRIEISRWEQCDFSPTFAPCPTVLYSAPMEGTGFQFPVCLSVCLFVCTVTAVCRAQCRVQRENAKPGCVAKTCPAAKCKHAGKPKRSTMGANSRKQPALRSHSLTHSFSHSLIHSLPPPEKNRKKQKNTQYLSLNLQIILTASLLLLLQKNALTSSIGIPPNALLHKAQTPQPHQWPSHARSRRSCSLGTTVHVALCHRSPQ